MAKRVLIVENDIQYRQMLSDLLTGLGYEALAAHDAFGAVRALRREIVSAVLLDVKMPKAYGTDMLRHLRHQGSRVPVVVISGYLTPDVTQELIGLGVRRIVTKPFTVRRVAAALGEWADDQGGADHGQADAS